MTDKAKKLGKEVVTGVYYDIPKGLNCGLSKREYFASLAMQAILSNPTDWYEDYGLKDADKRFKAEVLAVEYADALLEELSKND